MDKPVLGNKYTLEDYVGMRLSGRQNVPCRVTDLMRQSPDAIHKLYALMHSEYDLKASEGFQFRGNGTQALVLSVGQNQVIRLSTSEEVKRINSEYVHRNHTRMRVIKLDGHYSRIEVAAFPCVKTLGEAIDQGLITEEEARKGYRELSGRILNQGYFLADSADYNLSVPRDNVGVYDNGDFTVLDGGMFGTKPVDHSYFHDFSREYEPKEYEGPISPLEDGPPLVSKSQIEHMRGRNLTMGTFTSPYSGRS